MNFKNNPQVARLQKLQNEMMKKVEEFHQKEFEIDYKNGSIITTITGNCEIKSIKINKVLIDPEDAITLEEMITEAVNEAVSMIKEQEEEITSSMTSGLGLGGLF